MFHVGFNPVKCWTSGWLGHPNAPTGHSPLKIDFDIPRKVNNIYMRHFQTNKLPQPLFTLPDPYLHDDFLKPDLRESLTFVELILYKASRFCWTLFIKRCILIFNIYFSSETVRVSRRKTRSQSNTDNELTVFENTVAVSNDVKELPCHMYILYILQEQFI